MLLDDAWKAYHAGDFAETIQQAGKTLIAGEGIDAIYLTGLALMAMGGVPDGLALLNGACTLRPNSPHIYRNAAWVCEQAGLAQEQQYFAEIGLSLFPDDHDMLLMKANGLVMEMKFDQAIAAYHELLRHDPRHVGAMCNLGNIYRNKEQFAEAERWFARVEQIDPTFHDLPFARATMATTLGDSQTAMAVLKPIAADVDAQFLLAMLYLGEGDYEQGFRLHRARGFTVWTKPDWIKQPLNRFDHWTEATDKTIGVMPEAGLGDFIQFVRYVPQLAAIAKHVTLVVPQPLYRLFQIQQMDNVTIKASEQTVYHPDDYDYTTTLMEMPYHFRTTLDTIPNADAYLTIPPGHPLPPTEKRLRVGLCWSGGGQGALNQRNYDSRRSFDLAQYAKLGTIPDIEFVSLQLGERSDQQRADIDLIRPLKPTYDLLDTAQVIGQLDLVITVDTSVAHLAAAMGKPTWILSRYDCCWRWLHNAPQSPWYAAVRVFGQDTWSDWSKPLQRVYEALKAL